MSAVSEYAEVVEEDQQQHGRADVAEQEAEQAVDAEFQLSVVGDLCLEDVVVELPAHEDAGEKPACRQQDVGRQEVERIEKREPGDLPTAQRTQRQRCQRRQGGRGGGRQPCRSLTAQVPLLVQVDRDYLVQRDGRGECCDDQQQEEMAVTGFGRETNRKIKKALEYMEKDGITESMLCRDPEKEQVIADIVGVGVKTLRKALRNKQSVLSLDDTGGEDSALGDRVVSQEKSVEEKVEQSSEMLAWLHRGIGLMNLQQKEKYGKTAGPLWSSVLMGFLRNNDALPPAEDAPARLANCDDLRPLEQDNCLWDILLLHRYVEFTVQPPYAPKALECAAVHALLEPGRNPAQDKTVAEFLGVSRAAVSQRRKTWQQRLMQMQAEQEEV